MSATQLGSKSDGSDGISKLKVAIGFALGGKIGVCHVLGSDVLWPKRGY
jgi:hypothetical protein